MPPSVEFGPRGAMNGVALRIACAFDRKQDRARRLSGVKLGNASYAHKRGAGGDDEVGFNHVIAGGDKDDSTTRCTHSVQCGLDGFGVISLPIANCRIRRLADTYVSGVTGLPNRAERGFRLCE